MLRRIENVYHSLAFRIILYLAVVLLLCIVAWGSFLVARVKEDIAADVVKEADSLAKIATLSTHQARSLDSGTSPEGVLAGLEKPEGFESIRLYYKPRKAVLRSVGGEPDRLGEAWTIESPGCRACHVGEQIPRVTAERAKRALLSTSRNGGRILRIITPIHSDPGCFTGSCHADSNGRTVLGVQESVVSLRNRDARIASTYRWIFSFSALSILTLSAVAYFFFSEVVSSRIERLIRWTGLIAQGDYGSEPGVSGSGNESGDEIGRLSLAIRDMGAKIAEKEGELNRQRDEYQQLFEQVPCFITVQDRDLHLIRYNREFARHFDPKPGAYCFEVYKGRSEKCDPCPVLSTFEDGESHSSEETGISKHDPICYRIVQTSAVRDADGEISGVMQMSLDITRMKRLEEEIRKSEENYRSMFNNIPTPVFVLDRRHLMVLDCNESVQDVYGYSKEEILNTSFLNFFEDGEQQNYALELRNSDTLNHARQVTRDGRSIIVNIRVSPYEYIGQPALLVTSSDIIRVLMVKQQLVQASKMATLGEIATGIVHELNQPLSVIKTASSFLLSKLRRGEKVRDKVLLGMVEEIDGHVDRASGIITHVREFGRKSEAVREKVQLNAPIMKVLGMFSRQLKLRDIAVVTELDENLPAIAADSNRIEQVLINLLINARDAIEEKRERLGRSDTHEEIRLKTASFNGKVVIEVRDTGIGIPKALLDRIFEPFFTTKRMGRGTGLGLSISYGIVQDYHGTLHVETVENEGANFIIQFPVQVGTDE